MLKRVRKIVRMSPGEIVHRVQGKGTEFCERWFLAKRPAAIGTLEFNETKERCRQLILGAQDLDAPNADHVLGSLADRCRDQARVLHSGEQRLLGEVRIDLKSMNWHVDPTTGFEFPLKFYGDLDLYNLPRSADIKYPWELSRHQYFMDLAAGHIFHDQLDSHDALIQIWDDWIECNPYLHGVNWTSGLEAAMRMISWVWTLAVLPGSMPWRAGQTDRIVESMARHGEYLSRHLSYYSSPFNHLIGEATALYLLGAILSEHSQAADWKTQARNALLEYGPNQFYAEGFCVEQGVSYHYYTLGFLTLALLAARRFDAPMVGLEDDVHKAFHAGLSFRRPDGRWPAVGDLDSARALPVRPNDFWTFDGLSACAAELFNDRRLAANPSIDHQELFWLFGSEAVQRSCESDEEQSEGTTSKARQTVMPDAGYVIADDGTDWMLFDAGPIAAGLFSDSTPSTAHGHADTLQLLYQVSGDTILEDSGIPFYNGDADWIRHFRSPGAHNTIAVEGVELVHPEKRLAWSREVARPRLTSELSDQVWLCSGTVDWSHVVVERHVMGLPGVGLWVADWIETDELRKVHWYWQLPSTASCSGIGRTDRGGRSFEWDEYRWDWGTSDQTMEASLEDSQEVSPVGLRCHGYDLQSPGKRLHCHSRVNSKLLSLTYLGRQSRPLVAVDLHGLQLSGSDGFEVGERHEHQGCQWQIERS